MKNNNLYKLFIHYNHLENWGVLSHVHILTGFPQKVSLAIEISIIISIPIN